MFVSKKKYYELLEDYHKLKGELSREKDRTDLFTQNVLYLSEYITKHPNIRFLGSFLSKDKKLFMTYMNELGDQKHLYSVEISSTTVLKHGYLHGHFCYQYILIRPHNEIYIQDFVVKPEYKNLGIGSNMLAILTQYASQEGYKKIYGKLVYNKEEEKNHLVHFYERNGYTPTPEGDPKEVVKMID